MATNTNIETLSTGYDVQVIDDIKQQIIASNNEISILKEQNAASNNENLL